MGRTVKECAGCGVVKTIIGRGLCAACYNKARRAPDFAPDPKRSKGTHKGGIARSKGNGNETGNGKRVNDGAERTPIRVVAVPFYEGDRAFLDEVREQACRERRDLGDQLFIMAQEARVSP